MEFPIDFILTWVDGNDPDWLIEKKKYEGLDPSSSTMSDANDECRYRENGLLRFWFRGVEKFVTCGQTPKWLNLDNPKLTFVQHKDFIPKEYLPTFNANTIEMNFHRISGLAEHFVYFNDDMFLMQPVEEDYFFKDGNPVLDTIINYPSKSIRQNWMRLLYNDYCTVNKSFHAVESIWKNKDKWFNISILGYKRVIWNFTKFLTHWSFPVSIFGHLALPHLKSSLVDIWDKQSELMSMSSSCRFRSDCQVNQWLLCAWNQAKGCFYPAHKKQLGKNIIYSDTNLSAVVDNIQTPRFPQICLNEIENNTISDSFTTIICRAFETILPDKSSFEL